MTFQKAAITKMKLIKSINRKTFLIIMALLVLSLIPRLWELTTYPRMIVDEPANLRDMNKLIESHAFRPIDYEWSFGQATIVHYPAITLIKAGIIDQFLALRITSVILSTLGLIPFYFIIKKFSNALIAFNTTILFSFSYYYLQFSRVGWTNIHTITLGLFLIMFVEQAIIRKSLLFYLISGLIAGLLIYTYRAGELYILAGFIFLVLNVFSFKEKVALNAKRFALFIFIFLLVSSPWISKILSNWNLYNLRANVVSIKNIELPYHNLYNQNEIIKYQILTAIKSWLIFIPINGDAGNIENIRYLPLSYPPINPLLIPLFWFGLISGINNWRKIYIWLFLFFSGLVLGQIMTVHPPNGSRGLILLPTMYIFIGYSLNYLYKKSKTVKNINLLFIILSIIVAIADFIYYQYWMSWIGV